MIEICLMTSPPHGTSPTQTPARCREFENSGRALKVAQLAAQLRILASQQRKTETLELRHCSALLLEASFPPTPTPLRPPRR